jgi:hypothetical protein
LTACHDPLHHLGCEKRQTYKPADVLLADSVALGDLDHRSASATHEIVEPAVCARHRSDQRLIDFARRSRQSGKILRSVLEEQILNDVGSYGRQIGQIGDALRVLVDHVKLDGLKPEEERALKALRYQLDEVDRLKSKRLDQIRAVGTA